MGRVLFIPKAQYVQGTLKLYRGDEWDVEGKVQDLVGGVSSDEDISTCSGITAYFPGAPAVAVACTILDASCGRFRASLPAASTPQVGLTDGPTSWYAVGEFAEGLRTFATIDQPLEVIDRGFRD